MFASGEHTGSTSWDGLAAAFVCDAGVESLHSESPAFVPITMPERPSLDA